MKAEPAAALAGGRPCSAADTVAVAFSGGRDSLALLHATAHAAQRLGLQVVALHVHHGLQAEADDWVRSAIELCRRWRRRGLPLRLRWQRLAGTPARGDSVEAWARRERYAALTSMAVEEGVSLVLLAQHRRDQAETVLLQALRGAGPRGLAAMPARSERAGLVWARPWLQQPREAVEGYIRRHRLRPIEDPSNADTRLARNRLRAQVWPVLATAFAAAETTLCAVAQRAQEADAALAELAEIDLAAATLDGDLVLARWLHLSPARRLNALRAWLARGLGHGAPHTLVARLQDELPACRTGRWRLAASLWCLLHRGRLQLICDSEALDATPQREPLAADLSRTGLVELPTWGGAFQITVARRRGVAAQLLGQVLLCPRAGGERFQLEPAGLPRSLKKQFQARGVPAHQRDGPLVWSDGRLLFAPGLGIDARAWARDGTPQLQLRWLPRTVANAPAPSRRSASPGTGRAWPAPPGVEQSRAGCDGPASARGKRPR